MNNCDEAEKIKPVIKIWQGVAATIATSNIIES
jgi:hypothetical protein